MDSTLLAVQLLCAGALAGLCWTVQLAVYALFAPLLEAVGADAFRAHHAAYTRAMGWVAAPLMLVEISLSVVWVVVAADVTLAWVGLGFVLAIWTLTFGWIVPRHAGLQAAPTADGARRLVQLNWVRTALWAARAALLAFVAVAGA